MVDFKDITQHNHTYLRSGMEVFDIVILTVPFQSNTIEIGPPFRTLQAPSLKQNNTALPPYVTRHVALFTSPNRLSPTYFKKPLNFTLPKDILTAPRPDSEHGIFSITMPRRVLGPWPCDCDCDDESEYIYRTISSRPIPEQEFVRLRGHEPTPEGDVPLQDTGRSWVHRQIWPYTRPKFSKHLLLDNIEIAPDLYYTAAGEQVASTMELSCRMGLNVAKTLWYEKWMGETYP